MKVSVIAPVLNEVDFIGYSIMAALPGIDSFHYGIDSKSSDGTFELVKMLSETAGKDKVFWYKAPDFNIDPMNMDQYNRAFNVLIGCAMSRKPDAILFLHPDMILRNPEKLLELNPDPLAWFTHMRSLTGDGKVITKGRARTWKNMHAPRFGLTYYGGYGSQNEDFYHKDITGNSHRHYGEEYSKYPFTVADSGLLIDHYCEAKDYKRRFEKMKLCLKTLYPSFTDVRIEEMAEQHPRVTLEESCEQFGKFEFSEPQEPVPDVFAHYKETFDAFKKEKVII